MHEARTAEVARALLEAGANKNARTGADKEAYVRSPSRPSGCARLLGFRGWGEGSVGLVRRRLDAGVRRVAGLADPLA